MPELPELEIIALLLTDELSGKSVKKTVVHNHIVVHGQTVSEFESLAVEEEFDSVRADGKFLVLSLTNHEIVVNPMLTGRFRVISRYKKPTSYDMVSVHTDEGSLWYSDRKKMGRIYLVPKGDYSQVAGFGDRGPSALDPDLTLEVFRDRIKRHTGNSLPLVRLKTCLGTSGLSRELETHMLMRFWSMPVSSHFEDDQPSVTLRLRSFTNQCERYSLASVILFLRGLLMRLR